MTSPRAGAPARKPLGLFGKMLALVIAMFSLIAITTVSFSAWNLNRRLLEEYSSKGVGIAESISSSSSELLLNRDASTIQAMVDQFRAIAGVGYVYVVDSEGDIVSHTFVPAVPKEILAETQKGIERGAGVHVQDQTLAGTGSFVHIGSPVLGGLAGSVHVGMDKAIIRGYIRDAILELMIPISAMLLISLALAYLYVRRITRPLTLLTAYARRVAAQDFSAEVRIESGDEVGVLAETMQQMAGEIARAQESLEEKVLERTRQLADANGALEQAKQAAEDANRTKSNFLSSVSHELRTPLTSILGFAKLIDKDFKLFRPIISGDEKLGRRAERVGSNLNIIVREGERLTRLINDVLDLAKIESGRVDWRDSVIEVKDLVEHSMQAVTGQFAGLPNVALKSKVDPGLPQVNVDRDRLTQVLINLLNNAAKFTKAGTVEVSAALNAKGEIQISVRDTGTGIPADFLEKVFEKFQQVTSDTLVDKPQGTGLGLPICREIVRHYGGRIWAESELGRGSTFVLTLPVVQAQAQSAPQGRTPGSRTKPLILVVDDDPGICSLLAQILEDDGYQVITAAEGQAALDLARSHRPDLITMDLMMPGMDGYTAIEHLRKDELLGQIPIVVITALGEHAKVDSAATLKKPVDEALLIRSIRSVLRNEDVLGQPCLVLEPVDHTLRLPEIRMGTVERVTEEALWQRLEAGFRGTVVISHGMLKGKALDRLAGYGSVQVVIVAGSGDLPATARGAAPGAAGSTNSEKASGMTEQR